MQHVFIAARAAGALFRHKGKAVSALIANSRPKQALLVATACHHLMCRRNDRGPQPPLEMNP